VAETCYKIPPPIKGGGANCKYQTDIYKDEPDERDKEVFTWN
jgi:hypothetical protein